MPIKIKCQCGKTLNAPDNAAGKAVKCPACGKPVKVPGAGAGAPAAAAPAPAPAPAAVPAAGGMDDLFDEEGFSQRVEAVCPVCRNEMAGDAVLCTKCGYHKELGEQFEGHKTAGVDIDHGTLALQKAEQDMIKDAAMQQKLISGAGMPWWMLALVLFVITSGLTIAVLAVNASRRVTDGPGFNPVALFLVLSGTAFYLVAQGAFLMIVVHAFKTKNATQGLLTLFVPFYAFYYVATNWKETWKFLVAAIVMGAIAGGFFAGAQSQGGV